MSIRNYLLLFCITPKDNKECVLVTINRGFFIAPIPKFTKRFQQTINHWFWRNSLKGPIHLSRA